MKIRRGTSLLPLLIVAPALSILATAGGGRVPLVERGLPGHVVVRSGDPAPASPRFDDRFDSLAASGDVLAFIDGEQSALFLRDGTGTRSLLHVGETTTGGGTIASLTAVAAGGDGTIVCLATLADRRQAILRLRSGDAAPEEVVVAGQSLEIGSQDVTVAFLYSPAVDGSGGVVASITFLDLPGAVVRFPRAGAPQVLMASDDPIGPGLFVSPIAGPAVSPAGRVAFAALLRTGENVLVGVDPGAAPRVLTLFPAGPLAPFMAGVAPAINDAGQAAFLSVEGGVVRVRLTQGGISIALAGPGSPAPGGGSFSRIAEVPPAIDSIGNVLFGAQRSNGRSGVYFAGSPLLPLVEEGMPAGPSGTFTLVEPRPVLGGAAAPGAGGTLHVVAQASAAGGIFAVGQASVGLEVASGDPIPDPRFLSFLDRRVPDGGGGPALAPGGLMIFDARLTGGARGLFGRDRSGRIRALVMDGDAAPDGGTHDGNRLAFHSINGSGTFAFLGYAPLGSPMISLFYGSLGGGAPRRVVDTEPTQPIGPGFGGSGDRVQGTPSRVDPDGGIAVPVLQPVGSSILMGYDGTALFRIAGPGDPAPGGTSFSSLFTGSLFTGRPIPPAIDDSGRVLFGAVTGSGDSALFRARVLPGGGGVPSRVFGAGDEVDGGRLSPFELQALDADAQNHVALQAIYSDEFDFADFLWPGAPAARLAARFDPILDRGSVLSVTPLLALLGEGSVAYGVTLFDGTELILAAEPGSGLDPMVLAATGEPSPDGGVYVTFVSGRRSPGRIATDGRGNAALAVATTAGPEEIVLYGSTNAPPTADAGPDRTVECAGPAGTEVTLDGGASTDPDGDPLVYRWTGPSGEVLGPRPTVTLPLGVSTLTLVVEDGQSVSEPDSVRVEVRDTLPPALALAASPSILWPPDGRMADVSLAVQVTDRCDPAPAVALVEVTSSEPGTGRAGGFVTGATLGTDDRALSLRAERSGAGPGRTYAITCRATDGSGNSIASTALVVVPHDLRR